MYFGVCGRGGRVAGRPLSTVSVRRIIQRRAKATGLTSRGATLPEAQLCGRWGTSRMVAQYARAQRAGRGAVARLRYGRSPS